MIRWITEFLGTASWNDVKESSDIHILDVRDLVDKEGNPQMAIKSKIQEALEYLQQGKRVVVCCDYGISRSNAIAAGILSKYKNISFHEAIKKVITVTGESQMKLEVISAVAKALENEIQKFKSKHSILLTGGKGFIGSNLLLSLTKYDFVAPSRSEVDLTYDLVKLDLLVKEKGIDTILHLANPRVYGTNESIGPTLTMLKNVLDVCIKNDLWLIYLSSWEVYSGYKTAELKADESLAQYPGSTYGQTKFLCETLIRHFHNRYGLRYTILRSSPVYGINSDRPKFIWNFLEKAMRNDEIITHKYLNGFPKLDLIHVDDICRAIICTIEKDAYGEFNIGTGVGTSTKEIAHYIIEITGSKSKVSHLQIESYTYNIVMDYTRASNVLGWHPKIELQQGLKDLIKLVQERRK
ncbi:MAG: NAD-dependent epimerase/dehydratase family protein [Candidatus Bathyarchaeia archaeon]